MDDTPKTTTVRFFEEQDRLRGGPADELCSEAYTAHLAGSPPMDLPGHKAFAATFYGAFPDLRHSVEEVIAEGDRAAVRFRLRGTNSGDFMGNPPSGKSIDIGGLAIVRVAEGKVVEVHGEFDQSGLLEQIGASAAR